MKDDDDGRYQRQPLTYRPIPEDAIGIVNRNKIDEEILLRRLDELALRDEIDKRWLAIGRTRLEEAFMAINRAVFQPTRLQI